MNLMKTLLELSAYSAVMIFAVLALKAIFKDRINLKIVVLLWILVLLRLIVPFTYSSPIHVDSFIPSETENTLSDNNESAIENTTQPIGNMTSLSMDNEPDNYNYDNSSNTVADTEPTLKETILEFICSISVWTYVLIIWLIGSCVFAFRYYTSFVSFNKLIKESREITDREINNTITEITQTLNLKKNIKVVLSRYVDSPVTFRMFKPIVILPVSFINRISKEKLNMILLHEFCHIKRNDIFFNVLWMFAKIFHWFNPFVWIAYNNYIEDIELACDEMVLGYLNDEQGFVYSQSLIDVIRFSKNIVRLPVALSFCRDKSKLRKRVTNMLKPQKKLKSAGCFSLFLAIVMVFTCFTTACQPTPDDLVVQNKNDGELEAAILETAPPQDTQNTEETTNVLKIVDTATNDAGTINVNIDANVVQAGEEKVTIARLERYNLTEEEMDRMVRIFFGGDVTYYDHLTSTKADYEHNIIYLQQRLTLDDDELLKLYEDKEIYDITEIKKHINGIIEELKEDAAKAPENAPVIEKFESRTKEWGGFYANVGYGSDSLGSVSYNEPIMGRESFSCNKIKKSNGSNVKSTILDTPVDRDSHEYISAAQKAQDLIDEIGIEGVELGDVYMVSDVEDSFEGGVLSTSDEYYVFCYERVVGERTIDFSFANGGYTDDNEVTLTVPYESLKVSVKDNEISNFYWMNPLRVTEVKNDNAAVQIDYLQAMGLAVNQIFAKYAYILDGGGAENIFADITSIEFEMVRMKEKNTDNYISVPAWKIYGEVKMKRSQEELDDLAKLIEMHPEENYVLTEYESLTARQGPNIITVNALDGSIIDMDKGY